MEDHMEADRDGTAQAGQARYRQMPWGDLIEGTKAQLQALGLGIGLAFPGELGGPNYNMEVRDQYGHHVRIARGSEVLGVPYRASRTFTGWPERPLDYDRQVPAPAGLKKRELSWGDQYTGPADALIAAGLVEASQLPGAPGMRKTRVCIMPDGTVRTARQTACSAEFRQPGGRAVHRVSSKTFRVDVQVSRAEVERRKREFEIAASAWLHQTRALPRPPMLRPLAMSTLASTDAAQARAAQDVRFQGLLGRIVAEASAQAQRRRQGRA